MDGQDDVACGVDEDNKTKLRNNSFGYCSRIFVYETTILRLFQKSSLFTYSINLG